MPSSLSSASAPFAASFVSASLTVSAAPADAVSLPVPVESVVLADSAALSGAAVPTAFAYLSGSVAPTASLALSTSVAPAALVALSCSAAPTAFAAPAAPSVFAGSVDSAASFSFPAAFVFSCNIILY